MAISPKQAEILADEKKKLTLEEIEEVKRLEQQIDILIEKTYSGGKTVTISVEKPNSRVLNELELRYKKVGWNFKTQTASPMSNKGFAIVLTSFELPN